MFQPAEIETHLMVIEALRSVVYVIAQTTKSVQQYLHGGIQHRSLQQILLVGYNVGLESSGQAVHGSTDRSRHVGLYRLRREATDFESVCDKIRETEEFLL